METGSIHTSIYNRLKLETINRKGGKHGKSKQRFCLSTGRGPTYRNEDIRKGRDLECIHKEREGSPIRTPGTPDSFVANWVWFPLAGAKLAGQAEMQCQSVEDLKRITVNRYI